MIPGKTPHGAFNKTMVAIDIEIQNGIEFENSAQMTAPIPDND
jgi:hypothetical protein